MKKIKLNQKNLQTIVSRVIRESQLLLEKKNACERCIEWKRANPRGDEKKNEDCIKCVNTAKPGSRAHQDVSREDMIAENRNLLTEIDCEGCGTSCTDSNVDLLWDCLYAKACACDILIDRCNNNPDCDMVVPGGGRPDDMREPETMEVSESELIASIERIVKEQTATLGFGNFGNLGIGTPTSKYQELGEDDETYNLNVSNKGDDPDYTDDGMDIFEDDDELEENVKSLVRSKLEEAQAKEAKKWIQNAVKRPGALRKKLGVKKGEKISLEKINQEMRKLKAKDTNKKKPGVQGLSKANARTYRQLNLAKTLKGLSKKNHAKESRKWVNETDELKHIFNQPTPIEKPYDGGQRGKIGPTSGKQKMAPTAAPPSAPPCAPPNGPGGNGLGIHANTSGASLGTGCCGKCDNLPNPAGPFTPAELTYLGYCAPHCGCC